MLCRRGHSRTRNLSRCSGVLMSMRKPNGRRIGLLLILIALLVYTGCLLWAEKLEQLSSFDLLAIITSICRIAGGIGLLLVFISLFTYGNSIFHQFFSRSVNHFYNWCAAIDLDFH